MTDLPDRALDPLALRALAHPLRLQLLRHLREAGPLTGSELAQRTGESTASTSYHLATLARHGFVEHDPTPGPTRRHKPWRATERPVRIMSEVVDRPPAETPEGVVLLSLLDSTRAAQDDYVHGRSGLPAPWADLGTFAMTDLTLTRSDFERLSTEVLAVIDRYRPAAAAAGTATVASPTARFAVSFVGVPVAVTHPTPGSTEETT